jgi:hypothetical protein
MDNIKLIERVQPNIPVEIPGKPSQARLITISVIILNWNNFAPSYASLVSGDLWQVTLLVPRHQVVWTLHWTNTKFIFSSFSGSFI